MKYLSFVVLILPMALLTGCGTCVEDLVPVAPKAAKLAHSTIDNLTPETPQATPPAAADPEPIVYHRHRQWTPMTATYQNISLRHPALYHESYYETQPFPGDTCVWTEDNMIAFGIGPAEYLLSIIEWPVVMAADYPWLLQRDRSAVPLQKPGFDFPYKNHTPQPTDTASLK